MKDPLRRWLSALPASCAICARWPARPVCDDCLQRHGRVLPRCPGCALPLAPGLERCIRCTEAGPGALHHCLARVDYAHPWSALVARLKRDPAWAGQLAALLASTPGLADRLAQTDLILPIPLSPGKLRQRGYNQAWELVKALRSELHAAPAQAGLLQRRHQAEAQHDLPREQRITHAMQAYFVDGSARARLRGRRVLLLDDVMTTGATLQSAAAVLLDAGAAEVGALVFARTPAPTLD